MTKILLNKIPSIFWWVQKNEIYSKSIQGNKPQSFDRIYYRDSPLSCGTESLMIGPIL